MAAGKPGSNDDVKIFVGGLHRETTEENLREHFTKFGMVVDSVVKRDPVTGNSRGFGFVQFEDASSVDLAMSESQHVLQGKQIDPKRAKAKAQGLTRIFVGGLDPNMPEEEVKEYFMRFGKIETIEMPFDKEKNARRGFCFVTFDSTDTVETITTSSKHTIGNRQVDVKVATPKDLKYFRGRGGQRGSFGGRGGGGGFVGGYGGGYGDPYAAGPPYGGYGPGPQGGYYPPGNQGGGYGDGGYGYGSSYSSYPPAQQSFDYNGGANGWYNSGPPTNGGGATYGKGRGAERYQPY